MEPDLFGTLTPPEDHVPAHVMTADQLQAEQKRVLIWYAAQSEPQTRQACGRALYHDSDNATSSACGRINPMVKGGLLEEVGMVGKRHLVQITKAGRRVAAELHERQREAA